MKNFRKNIDKKVWGVLGKQQTYYSPNQFVGERVPLNANPLEAWDTKRSRYKRVDLVPKQNDGQQAGVVPEASSSVVVVTPTPTPTITQTNTPTPSFTPTQTETNTPTPTLTPSSTPFNLPSTPDLWYDATNVGSIDYITSGGTDYVSGWRSVGNYNKTLTGTTTDTMPVWSASTLFPGNPKIIRFNKSTTTTLRDFLTQRFDSTVMTGEGITVFTVIAKPSILDYNAAGSTTGFGLQFNLYSGDTTTGGYTPMPPSNTAPRNINNSIGAGANLIQLQNANSGITVSNPYSYSATNLNDKFLLTQAIPFPTGNPYFEINQSGGTLTNAITGTPVTTFNAFTLGATVSSGGTITASNSGCELAEIMIYTRELTVQEQDAVQNYLRDKWRYDEWASPVPTPTQTASSTQTPTQTTTNTPSLTPTNTPTPSAPPFNPLTLNPMIWVDFNDASTLSLRSGQFVQSASNKGNWTAFTGFSQTTAANQPSWSASTMGTSKSAVTISNDFLESSTIPTGSTWNTFAVLKYGGTDPFSVINVASTFGAAQSWSNLYAQRQLDRYVNFKVEGTDEYRRSFSGYTGFNTTHIAQGYMSNSALTIVDYFNINNSAQTETIESNSNTTTGWPGAITNSPFFRIINNEEFGASIPGEIGEIYMFDKELTSTEQANLINYLKTKWGIT